MRRMTVRGRCLRRLLVAVAALALLAHPGLAQDSAVTVAAAGADTMDHAFRYRLLGVYDAASGLPVAGAEVSDVLSGTSARTSSTGTVSLFFLPDGGSLVRIRKVGYAMQTMVVAISPADTVPLTVVLQPAVQLPEVVTTGRAHHISPNLRGFEERRLHGTTGYFISDSVLRKEESRTLANVLRTHIPDIHIVEDGSSGSEFLVPSRRCMMGRGPDVYVDGVLMPHFKTVVHPGDIGSLNTEADHQPINLSEFQVAQLAGVEYYLDSNMVPAEFSATSKGCGVLLLWTRAK